MVYDARCFDALTDTEWDDERIRVAIREIVADADAAFDESLLWPADEWDAWQTPTPLKSLYVGAAGVIWALEVLARRDVAVTSLDLPRAARQTVDAWRAEPDLMRGVELPRPARAGFLTGQAGILTLSTFAVLTAYAWISRRDFSAWGSFFVVGLWILIATSLLNLIFRNESASLWLAAVTVFVFSGLLVFRATAPDGFSELGRVTHPPDPGVDCSNWWTEGRSQVRRSVFMDDYVYSISGSTVKVNALGSLATDLATIPIAN